MSGRLYTWIKWQNRLLLLFATVLTLLALSRQQSSAATPAHPLVASLQQSTPSLKLVTWNDNSNLKIKHPRYNKRFQKSSFLEIVERAVLVVPEVPFIVKAGILSFSVPDDHASLISLRGPPVYSSLQ